MSFLVESFFFPFDLMFFYGEFFFIDIVVVHLIFNEFSFLYVCHDGVCGYSRSGYGCQSQSYLVGRRFDAESFDAGEVPAS